jgi:hypothetical protein
VQYQLAFSYFVGKKPNGWTNLMLATVCLLIPAVGPIVALGYRAEVAERLSRDPDLRRHPDFAFDRFMDLLVRGLWPFLIQLIGSLVLMPFAFVAIFGGIGLGAAINQPAVGMILGFMAYMLIALVGTALLMPMVFHAELANRFDIGGGFRFAVSFLKLVGGKAVVTYIVFTLLAVPITFLGLLLCIVGMYPALVLVMMAGQHLMVQLYLDYLDRGGEEIVKTETDQDRRRSRRRRRDEDDEDDGGGYDIDTPPKRGE